MALHPNFPSDPHAILDPSIRWFPADESLREKSHQLTPPLVAKLRREVKAWRDAGYPKAAETSRSLLRWWFQTDHFVEHANGPSEEFRYFFAQREALETIVYLVDVADAKDKFDLMRYDSSGLVSAKMFAEEWRRYVVKMATGAGKTKVLSLVLAWSYFHKLYEPESTLARNFLVVAPNIIVLDRIRKDFDGLRIFFHDPVLPDDGCDGRDWRSDFQLTLHIQDEVRVVRKTGNIFLTNIHRVYAGDERLPSAADEDAMDYFLGPRPTGGTTESRVDLGTIVRDIDELAVLNDEAHHIHDEKMAWFKSIEDIHNRLKQKDAALSLQIDVTATPRHNNGAIFVQTVADYPLVEAISQNVVKHPVVPDAPSRAKLKERTSAKFTEKYADYLNLGVVEWRKTFAEHERLGKKAILFVMTDDTKNCDEVAEFLEGQHSDLKDAVLVIHTKNNGDISEAATGKQKEELEKLRKQANEIDGWESPFRAIVSVLMLKEGWDVRNVTTIVGLRAYGAQSKILPEQTLGRGLRKMYREDGEEIVSVVGTDAFMDFVDSLKAEGVVMDRKPMGGGTDPLGPLVVEVADDDSGKDLDALDIQIPVLTPRMYKEYKNLSQLDPASFGNEKVPLKRFTGEEQREIVFKDVATDEVTHKTILDSSGVADWRSAIAYFANTILRDLKLFSGYDAFYGKVKEFVRDHLFEESVDLEDANTLRNLSELNATKTLTETLKKAVNALTVTAKGDAEVRAHIKLRDTRPFIAKSQGFLIPKRSVFERIIGDNQFELEFAAFLDGCDDVEAFAKNYMAVGFKIDYVNSEGDISHYVPDFLVKVDEKRRFVVETKGLEDVDVPPKMARLKQWCADVNAAQSEAKWGFVFVDEEGFEKYKPKSFSDLIEGFRDYQ